MTAGTNDLLPFLLKKIPRAPPAHPEAKNSVRFSILEPSYCEIRTEDAHPDDRLETIRMGYRTRDGIQH